MKATEAKLLDFLKKSPQFVIPIYQRTYSWTEKECQQLWDDILTAGSKEDISAHFIGAVVYIEKGIYQVTTQSPLLVIDGQQRLTTVSILLEALARHVADKEPIDGFSAKKIRNYYLLNALEEGDREFKLLLTRTDRETLLALMKQRSFPENNSLRIEASFDFFINQIKNLGNKLEELCKGLNKLMIVDIALNRDQDNPQLIFESMNSTGRELSQADLIRNYVLMGLNTDHQNQLYQEHWRPMEEEFGQEGYGEHFDSFMRHFLTIKTGDIPKIRAVYEAFKLYSRQPEIASQGVDALVAEIHKFAKYYCAMALKKERNKELAKAFKDLRELRVDVVYPLLLALYDDYENNILNQDDFCEVVRLVESYVFRRAVCSIPTNSLNKTFATFNKAIQKERYLESIKANFSLLKSYRRFPDDREFQREIKIRDLYNFPRRSYWLRRIENHNRKEMVPVEEYTIEHILPQNSNLSQKWRQDLGDEWERIQETYLHTLGNLTLTGYNSEYSDRPFAEKRDMSIGFKQSPLKLNEGLGGLEIWDEAAINDRAEKLAELATDVWKSPYLDAEVLDRYRPKAKERTEYCIEDHNHLNEKSLMRPIFEELRKQILSLDPCVTEEFLKLYVAYKAETNFVDIVPLAKQLRLTLNMAFNELDDPKGYAKDVTNLGRWGNGDVEVEITGLEELAYIVGLIRQAFEKQMGNGVHN